MAGVGAVRGHGMEENDGAMDSVINKADFQEMIKNKDVDKEVGQFEAIWASTRQSLSSGVSNRVRLKPVWERSGSVVECLT